MPLLAVALVPGTTAVLTLPRKSQALPWLGAPAYLEALPGNADFDPLRLGSASPALLKYYREAELKHGRLAMLAAVGWPASELWDEKLADTFGIDSALTSKLEAPSVLNGGLLGRRAGLRRGDRVVRPQVAPRGPRRAPGAGQSAVRSIGNVPRRARAAQAHGRGRGQTW